MNWQSIWSQLQREGLVPKGDAMAPDLPADKGPAPLLPRVLLGFGGWIAGLLILLSLAVPFSAFFDSREFPLAVGLLLIGSAAFMHRRAADSEFVAQLAFAISIAGQIAMTVFFAKLNALASTALAVALMQCVLVFLIDHPQHRTASALFAFAAFATAGAEWRVAAAYPAIVAVVAVVIWWLEPVWVAAGQDERLRPVGYASWFTLLLICTGSFVDLVKPYAIRPQITGVLLGVVWVILVGLYSRQSSIRNRILALLGALVLAACCWRAPGLLASAIALLMAFERGTRLGRVGVAVSLVAIVAYLFAYYRQTETTLLAKAATLGAAGIALWISAAVMKFTEAPAHSQAGKIA